MNYFKKGQRVLVNQCMNRPHGDEVTIGGIPGTVARLLMRDDSAWIELDHRSTEDVHPFPDSDSRGNHVLAWPEQCEDL